MLHDLSTIESVLENNTLSLESLKNVVATGIGYKVSEGVTTDELCIICSVTKKVDIIRLLPQDAIPRVIDEIPTDVVEKGKVRALQSRTGRHRPAPGGVSIAHVDVTAGTLGCLVKKNGRLVILSNNHILADSNDAPLGSAILQPGPIDGGRLRSDHIANLLDFVPINFSQPKPPSRCRFARVVIFICNIICQGIGSKTRYEVVTLAPTDNLVDAAIAMPLEPADVVDTILDIGPIRGVGKATLGMAVKKSGRTTGLTTDKISQVNVTVKVSYGGGKTARFVDQLMAGPMSQGGDSGSAVLNDEDELVGLLFAGSENSTIINHIGHVFSALNVSR